MRFTTKVIPSRTGNIGRIHLSNPSSLNALDLDMVRFLNDLLPSYTASSSSLKATILTSNTNKRKVFCAGGDVKSVYMAGKGLNGNEADIHAFEAQKHGYGYYDPTANGNSNGQSGKDAITTAAFFREEYQLNHKIAQQYERYSIPQISIWDGIVMGGGVGLSVHGTYRVCTQHTKFAMPETNIGFFPDVGATYVLSRLKGGIGPYLALTGKRLNAYDLMHAGLATHHVPSENIDAMLDELTKQSLQDTSGEEGGKEVGGVKVHKQVDFVARVLMSYHEEIPKHESFLAKHREQIDECFVNQTCVEDIVTALEKSRTEFATTTLQTLHRMSPTSLKVAFESLKRSKQCDTVAGCLKMEYRISQHFMRPGSDFYEGIRAALVDKDRAPKWKPSKLEEVTVDILSSYFDDLGDYELMLDDEGESKLVQCNL